MYRVLAAAGALSVTLATAGVALAQSYPEIGYRNGATVQSKVADMTGDIRPALLMLMAAVFAKLGLTPSSWPFLQPLRLPLACFQLRMQCA